MNAENIIVLIVVLFALDKFASYATMRLFVTGRPLLERRHHDETHPSGIGDEWHGARSVTAIHDAKGRV